MFFRCCTLNISQHVAGKKNKRDSSRLSICVFPRTESPETSLSGTEHEINSNYCSMWTLKWKLPLGGNKRNLKYSCVLCVAMLKYQTFNLLAVKPNEPQATFMDPVADGQGQRWSCSRSSLSLLRFHEHSQQDDGAFLGPMSFRYAEASRRQEVSLLARCDALGAGHSPGSESGAAVMWPVSHIFPETHRTGRCGG